MNIKTLSILFSIEYLLPNQNIFLVNFIKNLYKKKLHLSSVLITNNSILKIDLIKKYFYLAQKVF